MTIGMLVESMAGKAGAMHGLAQDATPFKSVVMVAKAKYRLTRPIIGLQKGTQP